MSFIIFFIVFFIAFSFQTYIIKRRFINKLDFSYKTRKYLSFLLYLTFFGVLLYPFARYFPIVPNWLYFLLSLPIGVIFLTFTIAIIHDIISIGLKKTKYKKNRRDFFKKSLDITTTSIILATNAKAMDNARNIEIEAVNIKLNNLKKAYKIVQLSDIHIGGLINQKFIKELVNKVNILEADVVVITGDLVDTNLNFAKSALDELRNIKSTYGTYFIVGNHEYFHDVSQIISYVNSLGIKVLENDSIYIGEDNFGFNLAGVYDRFGYRFGSYIPDINKTLKTCKKDSPTILLAHQPKYIKDLEQELENTKDIDLILSGHTHGGQIFPFNFLVKLEQPYVKGLHQHNTYTQIYVNKGTGFWGPPMRLGASSEITVLSLS
ncbi:putative metallophosphoesterase [Aliarcobacter thereius]|uniref:Metallophosphoesterase n=2 Tax=Aliarcobacter thereius TaxID=544718 RepID=A0A1C7WN40_9BACT|nr:metallophosphoesterase [Aliarcobacter thereius]OCL88363.1 putative metallophosphoesterase [Aliarcobacter thereius]OCL91853.1 putative metallophosphoesterase [Aliarcobacter thereius]OCL95049.1 putative metallophosphoesterase [Aliarcobacter thereius LMG 24486]OCM00501.1 putative metallophosphoesterase [Aliarcobacter thereius]QBF16959.1 metallophosphoesterase [Aliarcobacter thereius LMG 24486]